MILCQRCRDEGGQAYNGWQILCPTCIATEDAYWQEDRAPNT